MSLNKEIFRIAIPNIIANISIPLLGIVDTALMGRMDDSAYIGAIALGGIIFNLLYWGFGFLRPGTTGLTAQAYGKADNTEIFHLLYRGAIIGFSIGLVLLLFHKPIGTFCFYLLSGSEKVERLAYEYYSIRILAAPAVICLFAFRGWFFGVQDAIVPMILTIAVNLLNIFFSWYLVMHQGMEVAGVAWGTVAAQWLTFLLAVCLLFIKHSKACFKYFSLLIFRGQAFLRFLSVNRDMFFRNLGLILVFSFFTDRASQISDDYLAITQILMQLFYLMSYAVDGFAYASESLVGKYLGAKVYDSITAVIKKCLIYGLGFGCFFAVFFLFSGTALINLFTNNAMLINGVQPYLIWLSVISVTGALAFIWDGVFGGAAAAKEMRDSMLVAVLAFFAVYKLTLLFFPLHAIWAGMVAFMLGRSIFQIVLYKKRLQPTWRKSLVHN